MTDTFFSLRSIGSGARRLALPALVALAGLGSLTSQAQTIYGVGAAGVTTLSGVAASNSLFTVNAANGAATPVCTLSAPSTANSVSSLDGLVYYITRDGAGTTPRLFRINPSTCANALVGNISGAAATVLGDVTLRATHCPDGRFYAASNTTQFFEINASTGATVRTLNWSGLPTGGSGDFACVDNGDLYLVAPTTNDGATYALYRAGAASFSTAANNSTVAITQVGPLGLSGVPNGITEGPPGTGCAASPSPCLYLSTGANQTWRANSVSGAATSAGTTGHALTDLSRSYPVDISFSKSVTPTTALQGQTVFYTLTASNPGPGVVSQIGIQDTFPAGVASASWACSVTAPGAPTLVSTGCGATPTGTGNINTTVSLSLNGSVRYDITATLSSTFSGTLTNVGRATITALVTDPNSANNTQTVSSTVTPATVLSITKTNAVSAVLAGSTTSYTVTVANLGPADAPNAVVTDPATAGLSCTAVSCNVLSGAAVCPASPSLSIANLQGGGVPIPTFPANSSLALQVTCTVTATGVP
ncbi:MAG: DUF11 domain-containing protein [Hydrogenophaga sp.]|nr:DUF11 domain-containing protein [Hydrogenophaga sp.]